jgi:hypothetical protein
MFFLIRNFSIGPPEEPIDVMLAVVSLHTRDIQSAAQKQILP